MGNTIQWHVPNYPDEEQEVVELRQVKTLVFHDLAVPVWQAVRPGGTPNKLGNYPGEIVRSEDLPAELAAEFGAWQLCAAIPFRGACYAYDFVDFMSHQGRGLL